MHGVIFQCIRTSMIGAGVLIVVFFQVVFLAYATQDLCIALLTALVELIGTAVLFLRLLELRTTLAALIVMGTNPLILNATYLFLDFVAHFGAFRDLPLPLSLLPLQGCK